MSQAGLGKVAWARHHRPGVSCLGQQGEAGVAEQGWERSVFGDVEESHSGD